MSSIMNRIMRRITRSTLLFLGSGAVIVAACAPAQPEKPPTSDTQSLGVPQTLGTARPQASSTSKAKIEPRRPPVGDLSNAHDNMSIPLKARRDDESANKPLSVESFVGRSMNAGERVQVTGTCLDQFHARGSAGPPPVSRSDWQLANGTEVVYVTGRMPASCASGTVTISATVGIDTAVVDGQQHARRFLVIPR